MEVLTANEAKTNYPVQITRSEKPIAFVEEMKLEMFRQMIIQSEMDILGGNLIDGETFMQELIDGKYDE